MRILFVTPYPLSPIRVRGYNLVLHLARLHDVKVLALCAGAREMADVQDMRCGGIQIIPVREQRPVQYLRGLSTMTSSVPLQVAFAASEVWQRAIEAELANEHFDLLHIESVRALGVLPERVAVPMVWDAVDCISHLYALGAQAGATGMMRLIGKLEARRVRAYERTQLQRLPHVLVTSEQERQKLRQIVAAERCEVKVAVLPNGVDQKCADMYSGARQAGLLVFSGKMNYHANIAGVLHLVEHIMPLLWRRRPEIRLLLAGSDPPRVLRRLARDPRIELTGHVPDLRPYIARGQVAVCPLPYAVGIQNKVLEAMALGVPVVASSCAAAGLQAVAGRDFLLADEPETFATCVLHLLDDQLLRQRITTAALQYLALKHNWRDIVQQLIAVYTEVLKGERL